MSDFDPTQHRMVPAQRWFEDFVLGERFVIPSRTQTSAVFAAFQTASGDTHPIHYDVEYCRSRGIGELLVQWAVAEAKARGCILVELLTHETRIDAQRFYKRLGFSASHVGMTVRF